MVLKFPWERGAIRKKSLKKFLSGVRTTTKKLRGTTPQEKQQIAGFFNKDPQYQVHTNTRHAKKQWNRTESLEGDLNLIQHGMRTL